MPRLCPDQSDTCGGHQPASVPSRTALLSFSFEDELGGHQEEAEGPEEELDHLVEEEGEGEEEPGVLEVEVEVEGELAEQPGQHREEEEEEQEEDQRSRRKLKQNQKYPCPRHRCLRPPAGQRSPSL